MSGDKKGDVTIVIDVEPTDALTVESAEVVLDPGLALEEVEMEEGLMSEEERKVKIKKLLEDTKPVIESLRIRQKLHQGAKEALDNMEANNEALAGKAFYLRTFIAALKEELKCFSVEIESAVLPQETRDWLRRVCNNFDRYLGPAINNFDQVRLILDKENGGVPDKKGKM